MHIQDLIGLISVPHICCRIHLTHSRTNLQGRGKLLHYVRLAATAAAVDGDPKADFVAIDRMNTRLKFDRFHNNAAEQPNTRFGR